MNVAPFAPVVCRLAKVYAIVLAHTNDAGCWCVRTTQDITIADKLHYSWQWQ